MTDSAPPAARELVATLADEGVSHLWINPGTDTAPVQEALAAARADGTPHPRAVMCTHEFVALSAAMGHHFVTGEPQAVMVHVDAGTLNLGGAIHNAQRNRLPVVIFAGRSPYTTSPDVPGHRDTYIMWQQEQLDQQSVLRGFGKWTMEVPRGRELGTIVRRAYQVARTSPSGPAYVMLPREVLMEEGAWQAARLNPPRPAAPDPSGLADLAAVLADARRPVVISARTGVRTEAVDALVRVAELIGAPVIDQRHRINFPPRHPLYAGPDLSLLRVADAVLVLDSEVPWVPAEAAPPADATIVQIDVDPVKATMPTWTYPVDVALTADTALALPLLEAELRRLATPERTARWTARREEAAAAVALLHEAWEELGTSTEDTAAPDAMLHALNRALPPEAIVLEEAVTNKPAVSRQIVREPGRHFDTGSPALGWGVAGALGVKLGRPEAPVVSICGDGSFNFGVPNAALFSAHQAGAPFVTVILNNGEYRASRLPVQRLFPDGAAEKHRSFPETVLSPQPDYARLAEALGGHGETVKHPDEVAGALNRALEAQADGRCAIIDAHLPGF